MPDQDSEEEKDIDFLCWSQDKNNKGFFSGH